VGLRVDVLSMVCQSAFIMEMKASSGNPHVVFSVRVPSWGSFTSEVAVLLDR